MPEQPLMTSECGIGSALADAKPRRWGNPRDPNARSAGRVPHSNAATRLRCQGCAAGAWVQEPFEEGALEESGSSSGLVGGGGVLAAAEEHAERAEGQEGERAELGPDCRFAFGGVNRNGAGVGELGEVVDLHVAVERQVDANRDAAFG